MSNKHLLEILKIEYQRLRTDRRNHNNNMFQLFFLLFSISIIGLASIVQFENASSSDAISNSILLVNSFWDIVIISYPIILYIFILIFFVLSDAILHNSVALSLVENKINTELKIHVLSWEESAVNNSLYKISSINFQATILIVVFFLTAYILCIYNSISLFQNYTYKCVYIISNLVVIVIYLAMLVYHGFFERKSLMKKLGEKYFLEDF